jgi:hypothetical protein
MTHILGTEGRFLRLLQALGTLPSVGDVDSSHFDLILSALKKIMANSKSFELFSKVPVEKYLEVRVSL